MAHSVDCLPYMSIRQLHCPLARTFVDLHSAAGACLCCTAAGLSGNWALPRLTITATSSPTPAAFMANLGKKFSLAELSNIYVRDASISPSPVRFTSCKLQP